MRGTNTTDLGYAVDADSLTCATIESNVGDPGMNIRVSGSTIIKTIVLYLPKGKSSLVDVALYSVSAKLPHVPRNKPMPAGESYKLKRV